jgi:hypothetical protein
MTRRIPRRRFLTFACLLAFLAMPAGTLALDLWPVEHPEPGSLPFAASKLPPADDNGFHRVNAASFRATLRETSSEATELELIYAGDPTAESRLASGNLVKQIGLRLFERDTCNLLQVMWRFHPRNEIVVMMKSNPDSITHQECGAAGYTRIKPSYFTAVTKPEIGHTHSLRTAVGEHTLKVFIDDRLVWRGGLPEQSASGSSGVRADNAMFSFRLRTPPPP